MFGAPGSAACAAAAKANGVPVTPGARCLLSGPDDNRQDLLSGPARRASARQQGQQLVVPPGHGRAPGAPIRPPRTPPRSTTRRAQFYVLHDHVVAVRQRHHQPAAEHRSGRHRPTSRSGSPRTARTRSRASPRRSPTAATWTAARSDAQPALRGRAGQQADHGPADRLQDSIPTGSRRQRRRHHRRLHDPVRPGPGHAAAPRRAADQAEADLRVAGLGDARQAGAAPGPDRRRWPACSWWRSSCSPSTACSA